MNNEAIPDSMRLTWNELNLKWETVNLRAAQFRVDRLEKLAARPSFSKRSYEKQMRHHKRLSAARSDASDRRARVSALETEIRRLKQTAI